MKPPLLIVNPACRAHGGRRALSEVLVAVEQRLGGALIKHTTQRGHARDLARDGVRDGHPLIIGVGGDGTLSEIVNGVLTAAAGEATDQSADAQPHGTDTVGCPVAGPAVGLINVGMGGDFRRSLGIGPGLEHCLEALTLGRDRLVDVGRASFVGRNGEKVEQYFINVLSAGLGGLVDRYIETIPTFLGGRAGYYIAALRAVAASREQPLLARITWDEDTREATIPAYMVAVCNGRWFGGGMDVAPMAAVDDGRFEVVTITAHTKPYLARRVRSVYAGRHLQEPTVHHFPCTAIELTLEDPVAERRILLDVDGDALGSLPLTVKVVPQALRIRA